MGWDVQINPTAEALHVTFGLVEVLYRFVEDFDMRYCFLTPSDGAITALRRLRPQGTDERRAIDQILAKLEHGDTVELLFGN